MEKSKCTKNQKVIMNKHVLSVVLFIIAGVHLLMGDVFISKTGSPPPQRSVLTGFEASDNGGTTSARYQANKILKDEGYYQRDRDLGQTFSFSGEQYMKINALTLRTGPSGAKKGASGAPVSIQFCEVTGTAVINDNGTTKKAAHGWCSDPKCDDYIEGERFETISIARGGLLPKQLPALGYLRFDFTGDDQIVIESGKTYAFIFMFDTIADDQSIALGNKYWGWYDNGHAVRREGGNGDPWQDFPELPEDWDTRLAMQPGTKGYPDVDTWRDFEFYIEAEKYDPPASIQYRQRNVHIETIPVAPYMHIRGIHNTLHTVLLSGRRVRKQKKWQITVIDHQ
jgi:hypothetical protein